MKISKFFEKLIMGKPKKDDFTQEDLPKTRVKALGFMIKHNTIKFINISVLIALFCLPMYIWGLISSNALNQVMAEEGVTPAEILNVLSFNLTVDFICVFVASFGFAGAFYVLRLIAWDEPVSTFKDFFKGIKYNFKQFLAFALFVGMVNYIFNYYFYAVSLQMADGIMKVVVLMIMLLTVFVLVIVLMFAVCLSSLYNMRMGTILKTAFLFAFKKLFMASGIVIVSVLPAFIMTYIPVSILNYVGFFALVCFGFSYIVSVWVLYTNGIFDEFINSKSYPDYVRKGLYNPEAKEVTLETPTKQEVTENFNENNV